MEQVSDIVEKLRHNQSFQQLVDHIANSYMEQVRELETCDSDQIERRIGKMAALGELLDIFRWR
jgi:uncharacterized protein (DUF433 family)